MLGLNSKVNYQGRITTIAELAADGWIKFTYSEHYGKFDKPAYFADVLEIGNESSGWRITKAAYEKGNMLYPRHWQEPKVAPPAPYTFAEKQAAIVSKLAGSGAEWLADVDYENWEVAYNWLMTSSLTEILDFAPVIESEHWNGSFPNE